MTNLTNAQAKALAICLSGGRNRGGCIYTGEANRRTLRALTDKGMISIRSTDSYTAGPYADKLYVEHTYEITDAGREWIANNG